MFARGFLYKVMKGLFVLLVSLALLSCDSKNTAELLLEDDFSKETLEQGVNIFLPEKSVKKLIKKRDEAVNLGHHFKDKSDYIRAELETAKNSTSILIRLKGDEIDHLVGEKWSLRIKSKNKKLAGHQKVSIQAPSTKNYIWEFLFQAWCKKEGIISLDYFFMPLSMNDSLLGIYAFEAVADNYSLKKSGRKTGPILRFDEDDYWKRLVAGETKIDSVCMLESEIVPYNDKWVNKSKERRTQFVYGHAKLDMYRKGLLPPNEVFDYDLFAKYVAISEVLGSSHNMRWINLRLYFNSESGKLEPMAFDCFDGDDPRNTVIWYNKPQKFEYLLHSLFADESFIHLVEQHLKVYSSQAYINSLLNENRNEITNAVQLLKTDEKNYFLSKKALMKRAEFLYNTLK